MMPNPSIERTLELASVLLAHLPNTWLANALLAMNVSFGAPTSGLGTSPLGRKRTQLRLQVRAASHT